MKYAIYAFIVSAVVTIALGPVIIPMLRRLKFGQNERSDGPQSHLSKAGTPYWLARLHFRSTLLSLRFPRCLQRRRSHW
mgnify:CR=1 FL=1